MSEPNRSGKLLSVRVPSEPAAIYQALLAAAGKTMSDGLRAHVAHTVESYEALGLASMNINILFRWRRELKPAFPEAVGDLRVEVKGGPFINDDQLGSLVFELPQFSNGTDVNSEPFRIDSFYFHRVANGRSTITSTRTSRNVLSFRFIEGKWRAGIFNYTGVPRTEMESEIRSAIESRVRHTVGAFCLGLLPDARRLELEEVKRLNATITRDMIEFADREN